MFIRNLFSGGQGGRYTTLAAITFSFIMLMCPVDTMRGQIPDRQALEEYVAFLRVSDSLRIHVRDSIAQARSIPVYDTCCGGNIRVLWDFVLGEPEYLNTLNAHASAVSGTNQLYPDVSAKYGLTGAGMTIGIWDAFHPQLDHPEYAGRLTYLDVLRDPLYGDDTTAHFTSMLGTLLATGLSGHEEARGIAYQAGARAYDYNNGFVAEMGAEALQGLLISSHSYIISAGFPGLWDACSNWRGLESISQTEDYKFGYYDLNSVRYDSIAFLAPKYLIVTGAGNNRYNNSVTTPCQRDYNGEATGGYDVIAPPATAKNVLTVGAIDELDGTIFQWIVGQPRSCAGPTDDGRIKPDLVALGANVQTTTSRSGYSSESGTSVATAVVTGSLALIQQLAMERRNGWPLRSSALKCLAIHTARDSGRPGPDYEYGWGLLNTADAAYTLVQGDLHVHDSLLLEQDGEIRIPVYYKQNESCPVPLKATICWTDPAADTLEVNQSVLNNTTPRLVNDLDLLVEGPGGNYYPWRLGGLAAPTSDAVRDAGRNLVDNVEQVLIDAPEEGWYTIVVNHASGVQLQGGEQVFSLVVTGNSKPHQMSSSIKALEGNNQRKVDYDDYGNWHQVHESGGEIYYTRSGDQGANRTVEHILSGGGGVSSRPSVFASAAGVFATWKEGATIQACVIPPVLPPDTCWASLYPPPVPLLKSDFGNAFPPSSDAGPVIAGVLMPTFVQGVPYELVVYETEFEGNVGLAYLWLHGADLQEYGLIQAADNDPDNPPAGPSLAYDKYKQFTDYQPEFHLAWRKADTIKYAKLHITLVNPLNIDYTQTGDINDVQNYHASGYPSVCPYWSHSGPGNKKDAAIAYRIVDENGKAGIQIALKDSSGTPTPNVNILCETKTVSEYEDVWSPSVMSFCRNERNGSPDNISCAFNYDDGNGNRSIQVIKTTNDGGSWTLMLAQTGDAENPSLVAFPPPGEELQIHSIIRQPDDELTQITSTTYLLQKRSIQPPAAVSSSVFLEQNYPNPFNPETEIAFSVAIQQRIRLSVHDCFGREVSVLQDGEVEAGRHVLRFSAQGLPSGVLLCRLRAEDAVLTKAMMLLK